MTDTRPCFGLSRETLTCQLGHFLQEAELESWWGWRWEERVGTYGTHRNPSAEQRRERALNWDSVGTAGCNPGAGQWRWSPYSGEGCSYMNIPDMSASDPWPNQSVLLLPKLPENSIPDYSKAEETAEKSPHRFQMRIWRSTISCTKILSHCPEPHLTLTSLEIIIGQNAAGHHSEIKP